MDDRHGYLPLEQDNLRLKAAIAQLESAGNGGPRPSLLSRVAMLDIVPYLRLELPRNPVNRLQQVCMHIMLGRGMFAQDQAFVIGFNLGCSNKTQSSENRLYGFTSRYLFPAMPELDQDARAIFKDAIKLGYISNCVALHDFDFSNWLDTSIRRIRHVAGVETGLLQAYFAVEKRRYPCSPASQRLLPGEPKMLVS